MMTVKLKIPQEEFKRLRRLWVDDEMAHPSDMVSLIMGHEERFLLAAKVLKGLPASVFEEAFKEEPDVPRLDEKCPSCRADLYIREVVGKHTGSEEDVVAVRRNIHQEGGTSCLLRQINQKDAEIARLKGVDV